MKLFKELTKEKQEKALDILADDMGMGKNEPLFHACFRADAVRAMLTGSTIHYFDERGNMYIHYASEVNNQ